MRIIYVLKEKQVKFIMWFFITALSILSIASADSNITSLEKPIDKMNSREKRHLLIQVAADPRQIDAVWDSDPEDKFKLLKEFYGVSERTIRVNLHQNLEAGKTFMELALEANNAKALKWLHEFLHQTCEDTKRPYKCVFKRYYCQMNLNIEMQQEYFRHSAFRDMIGNILKKEYLSRVGNPSWWKPGLPLSELDSWNSAPHNVCSAVNNIFIKG